MEPTAPDAAPPAPFRRLDLADYRQRVASMFLSDLDLAGFRKAKDELFATHSQSPIEPEEQPAFAGLRYYPPNEDAIVTVPIRPAHGDFAIETNGPDGAIVYERVGILETPWGELTLWWLKAYGGGLFLPFRDGTAAATFGGPNARTAPVATSPTRSRARSGGALRDRGAGPRPARLQLRLQPSRARTTTGGRARSRRRRTGWPSRSGPARSPTTPW